MAEKTNESMLAELADGRTDLVFDLFERGCPPGSVDRNGVSLIEWGAYYGDVSAIKFLLSKGESIDALGPDRGLNAASFHGHWRLCQFLLEQGADVNFSSDDSGETPLHAALCKTDRVVYDRVLKVLLSAALIRTQERTTVRRQGDLCGIAKPREKRRCIAPLPLGRRRQSSFCSKPERRSMRKMQMAIPR